MNNALLQPVLTGNLLSVRPIAEDDWTELFSAASDPDIWEQHPDKDRYQESVFRRYFDDAINCGSALVVMDNSTQSVIGSSRYNDYDAQRSEIEIGWTFLARAYWGGKYNRELKRLMTNHALSFVDTVLFWVGEHNLRSQRAVEKIGGVRREGFFSREPQGTGQHVIYEVREALE